MSTSERGTDVRYEFEPLTRETLSAQIRERLLQRITDGTLAPGARLPSERDLAEQFRVARTSVREAMQGLVSMGVVERRGNRSYVVEHLPDVNFDAADDHKEYVRQLCETRRLLELPMIGLAAERATTEQRDEIRQLAAEFRADMATDRFRRLDHQFHAAIARACGNPLLIEVHGKVMNRLFHSDAIDETISHTLVAEAAAHHSALARAIADGDPAAAVARGTEHLAAIEHHLIDRIA